MAFRFLLLGAVASLGFDLPQGIDVDAWAQSGRAWWHARVSEFEARHGIALAEAEEVPSPGPAARPEAPAPDADAAFATVIEDVVAAFAADGHVASNEEPDVSSQLVAGVDDAAFGPDFADALNRWADGLSEPEDPATLADEAGGFDPEFGPVMVAAEVSGYAGSAFAASGIEEEASPEFASEAASAVAVASAADRPESEPTAGAGLAEAVRLTGQALQAWLALVQPADGFAAAPTL